MNNFKLGAVEARFADIIWQNEPLPSSQLAKLAEQELSWKKSTAYTILKRLCDRGIFQNQREEFYALQSENFVNETFNGSLPAFVAAFGTRKKLSSAELDQLQSLIQQMRG